jgi:hypothetical protein
MSDSPVRLSLSAKGLQRLEQVNHEKDFTFIVGDDRYPCPSFVAEFLSPRVSALRSEDITIDEISIETKDPLHEFGILISIGFGGEISLSGSELSFVRSVCGELKNRELFDLTLPEEGVQAREEVLKARIDLLRGFDDDLEWDVGIVASLFYEFSVSDFDHLSRSVLETILGDSRLVVQDEDSVFDIVHRRSSDDLSYLGLLEYVRFEFLSADCMTRAFDFICDSFEFVTFGIWSSLRTRLTHPVSPTSEPVRFHPLPPLDSKIVSDIPEIFSVLGQKKFALLYRGSRDGFQAKDFHDRCDGHKNTVSLILSTNGSIFGGYTPIPWHCGGDGITDSSQSSFLFTIKNPHGLPAQVFKQKQGRAVIFGCSSYGPRFGNGWNADLSVYNDFRTPNTVMYSNVGDYFANDTGIAGNRVLTGATTFTVEQIEVFEVI